MINKIKPYVSLIFGLLLIAIGVLCFINGTTIVIVALYMLSIYMIVSGIWNLIISIFGKKHNVLKALVNLAFGIVIICSKQIIFYGLIYVALLYLFLIVTINLITYIIYSKLGVDRNSELFNTILNLVFFLILLFNPDFRIRTILLVIGIYLIILGLKNIFIFVLEVLPKRIGNRIKKIIEFPIPLFAGASITRKLDLIVDSNCEKDTTIKPNFYILIHSSDNKKDVFGHIELALNDKVYSYGNYNRHSRKFFNIFGDGIILVANKNKYIKYCTEERKKKIAEFGVVLNTEQLKMAEDMLNSLVNNNTEDYYSDVQLAEQGKLEKREYHDFSSELYLYADAIFKRVLKGKNKVFFLAMNNCTLFSRDILEAVGNNVLIVNGISSPGIYFDYLNSKYKMFDSNVVSKKIYVKESKENGKN